MKKLGLKVKFQLTVLISSLNVSTLLSVISLHIMYSLMFFLSKVALMTQKYQNGYLYHSLLFHFNLQNRLNICL